MEEVGAEIREAQAPTTPQRLPRCIRRRADPVYWAIGAGVRDFQDSARSPVDVDGEISIRQVDGTDHGENQGVAVDSASRVKFGVVSGKE